MLASSAHRNPSRLCAHTIQLPADLFQSGSPGDIAVGVILVVFIPVVFLAWSFYLIFTRVVQVPLRKAAFILDEEKLQVNLHCAQACCSISGLLVGSRRHGRPNQHWAAQLEVGRLHIRICMPSRLSGLPGHHVHGNQLSASSCSPANFEPPWMAADLRQWRACTPQHLILYPSPTNVT